MKHQIRVTAEAAVPQEDEVRALIERCAGQVLEEEGTAYNCFVDVTLVGDEEIRALNAEYRGKDAVTDVLSFPMYEFYNGVPQEELEEDPESGCVMLGDMILNYERAVAQAEEFGHSPARECGFLTVHSVLHLLGYDHERGAEDCALMRTKEEQALTKQGLLRETV